MAMSYCTKEFFVAVVYTNRNNNPFWVLAISNFSRTG